MKFSSAIVFLASVASSAALSPSLNLLKAARRLEDGQEQNEYAFLQGFTLKMLQCKAGETYVSPVDGSYEYSSVVFRLCPNNCDNDDARGCSTGYGDYVVGLNSFAAAYLEEKRDEMQGDDDVNDWKFEKFGECQEWEVDKDAEFEDEDAVFYVGPECTEDATGVKLALFSDALCETESETYTFEQISNGVSLPYSSGGLIGTGCEACYGENDRGEMELSEMCTNLYMYSGKCETGMETYHASGKNEASCETIMSLMPVSQKSRKSGGAVGWVIFGLVIVGAAAYGMMMMKKKQDDKRTGLMA